MTQETSRWLYDNVKTGFQKPWHYNESDAASVANHYPNGVPFDVARAMLDFGLIKVASGHQMPDGTWRESPDKCAILRRDTGEYLATNGDGFKIHDYAPWLCDEIEPVLGPNVGIASVVLLRKGARASVQVQTPETFKSTMGIDFRPFVLFATAVDGSFASTTQAGAGFVVCDNTLDAFLRQTEMRYRVKHTANSVYDPEQAKRVLNLIETIAETTDKAITKLAQYQVTDSQFNAFMSKLVPMPEKSGLDINKRDYSTRAATIAANKREKLNELYRLDGRVAPWAGTALGVLQMVNTFNQHAASIRGAEHRVSRNLENVISGKNAAADLDALDLLAKVCERELVLVAA